MVREPWIKNLRSGIPDFFLDFYQLIVHKAHVQLVLKLVQLFHICLFVSVNIEYHMHMTSNVGCHTAGMTLVMSQL